MQDSNRPRIIAGTISLIVGTLLMSVKFLGYSWTGSTAVLSDAMESIVNIVAAGFVLWVIHFAHRPADKAHPYGHGKIEYFSAVFEGGLITFAAVLISYEAVMALLRGPEIRQINLGLIVVMGAGIGNLLLGMFLVHMGKRTNSTALTADGQHVLTDFWTSLGVVMGLLLVRFTGIVWLDPIVALIVAANLARTGFRLVRKSGGGLLDEEDPELIKHIVEVFNRTAHPGIIRLHHLRAIRAGRTVHIDAHLVVPGHWSVFEAHEIVDRFEGKMMAELNVEGELVFHLDPCRQAYCPACDVENCDYRREPLHFRDPLTVEEAIRPDPPKTYLRPLDTPTIQRS